MKNSSASASRTWSASPRHCRFSESPRASTVFKLELVELAESASDAMMIARIDRFPETIEYLRLSVADVPTARISELFPTVFAFIDR